MDSSQKEIQSFKDLKVWQDCREVRKETSILANKLPDEEKYRLKDQLLRASRSVTANIAEGYGRFHYQENIQFCRQARGSLYELLDHISCSIDEKYLSPNETEKISTQITTCIKLLNGYIAYLKKAKQNHITKEPSIEYGSEPNNQ
ncbi:four helix bundle protein [Fodinibius halophilus]|uniref:Four helix bundle protein n=1 Tax=Fodinibius halophilus TaxID=1736908 RepID=A0A6M1TIR3_9BACT|nr:four helix bundle protein [Fodinibius halophilus]NGP88490.1 four helix bundle protein [Fodinibius halophilus]